MSAFRDLLEEVRFMWLELYSEEPRVTWAWAPGNADSWTARASFPDVNGLRFGRVYGGESGEQVFRKLAVELRALYKARSLAV